MEHTGGDLSDAYFPQPMEESGDARPPALRLTAEVDVAAVGAYDMDDSELLSSSFPHVPGYGYGSLGEEGVGEVAQPAAEAAAPLAPVKRKRGRPRKNPDGAGKPPPPAATEAATRKVEEEESVCFVCLDGGNLVVCDRRGCTKAYHPACVKRDEAFFRSKGRWNCGWHICTVCGKAANFMCYTCPYSLCKRCIKGAQFFCVRVNKGFCEPCYDTVELLEYGHANGKKVNVNFDDRNSWEYLFKVYWLVLKGKLSLTVKEVADAKSPGKAVGLSDYNDESSDELYDANDEQDASSDNSIGNFDTNSRKKFRKRVRKPSDVKGPRQDVKSEQEGKSSPEDAWASQELLEFVAHMKHGDKSLQTQFDVQTLLLEYIKQNNLRDPRKQSQIICDARLQNLFGKARVGHFEMLKLLELHFFVKEGSEVGADDKQEGSLDHHMNKMDSEELTNNIELNTGIDKRRKNRKKVEEREPQNVNDYAAIDAHNINLIYLRRSLMEELIDGNNAFREKVIGSFVRIRISGASQKQDMYRLVQIVGTQMVAENYKVGKKTTNITLEILNLDKMETVGIDTISNQDFTEEECRRLRQSIKCGLISRLTVGDVHNKAKILQAVRVTDWLESEKLRLTHLRDRASETGRRKDLRECIEKLKLLSTPEEHMRRLNEVPEIHVDPHMDPNYESPEEEADEKRGKRLRESLPRRKRKELFSPIGSGSVSSDNWSCANKSLSTNWTSNNTSLTEGSQDKLDALNDISDRTNEALWNWNQGNNFNWAKNWETQKAHTIASNSKPSLWNDNHLAGKPGEPCRVATEAALSPVSHVILVLSRAFENDKIWHYQDPNGKIQGPFSVLQLRKWRSTGYFPPDLRIWLTSQKQEDAILLTDALTMIEKAAEQQEQFNNFPQAGNFAGTMGTTQSIRDGDWRGNNDLTSMEVEQNGSCMNEILSDHAIPTSSHNVENVATHSADLRTQKEEFNSHSGRSTQFMLPKGNPGREVVSSHDASTVRDTFMNKNQFFESSCPSPTPGSEIQDLSPVRPNELDCCQTVTKASETYGGENLERGCAPLSIPSGIPASLSIKEGNVELKVEGSMDVVGAQRQNFSLPTTNLTAEFDELKYVLVQETPVSRPMPQPQEQLPGSAQEQNRDGDEIGAAISVSDMLQNQNEDPEPSFIGSSLMDNSNLEGLEDTDNLKWSVPSPTPVSKPSEWILSSGCVQGSNQKDTFPSSQLEACTSQQNECLNSGWQMPAKGNIHANTHSSWEKQLQGNMKTGCGCGTSSPADPSGANSGWREQSWGSMGAGCGWGSSCENNTNGCSGWGTQSQGSTNDGGRGASTVRNKSDANSGWGSGIQGNPNPTTSWGSTTREKENPNSLWGAPAARLTNENSGWGTPGQQGSTNVNLGLGTARDTNTSWGSGIQGNSNPSTCWGSTTREKEKTNSGWTAPVARHTNENSGWGTAGQQGSNVSWNSIQNWDKDRHLERQEEDNESEYGVGGNSRSMARSGGGGGSWQPYPRGEVQRGICKFHESGFCKRGSNCKYLHS